MMKIPVKKQWLVALAGMSLAGSLQAELANDLTIHPKALALGNAVVADPPGLMAIHFNPAGLAKMDGRQLEVQLMNVYIDIQAHFTAPDGFNIFGITNDPVIDTHSRTHRLALFIPGVGLRKAPTGPAAVPSAAFSYHPPGSKLTFGNAFFIPNAQGFFRDLEDPGRFQAKAIAIQRITYLSPTVAYQINDDWAVGLGIHMSHFGLAADQEIRAPNLLLGVAEVLQDAFNCESGNEPLAPFVALCGGNVGPFDSIGGISLQVEESVSPNFNVGVLWTPTDWFSWGADYRSESDMKLNGTFELKYTDDWSKFWQSVNSSIFGAIGAAILSLPSGVSREAGNLSVNLKNPQHFQTGISVKLNPKVTANLDASWADFSVWDALNFSFDRSVEFASAARLLAPELATPNSLRFPLGMKDAWSWGLGFELHASDRLDMRIGVQSRSSVIPKDQRSIQAPIGKSYLYGAGMGYQWDKDTVVDMSLSFMQSIENIPANGSCNVNCDNISNVVNNPFAGLDIKTRLRFFGAGLSFRTKF